MDTQGHGAAELHNLSHILQRRTVHHSDWSEDPGDDLASLVILHLSVCN